MYRVDDENRFLEVTYQGGDKEVLYFKDFASGAMIENIVRRAKKIAVKREIAGQGRGLRKPSDLVESIRQEFRENEDLPNTTNPDDWARISGKKGERIIFIRTLVNREEDDVQGRTLDSARGHRPVPLGPWRSPRCSASRPSTASRAVPTPIRSPRRASSSTPTPSRAGPGLTGTSRARRPTWTRAGASTSRPSRRSSRRTSPTRFSTNGARLYVDHAHPEYSSPECRTPARGDAVRRGRRRGHAPGRRRSPTRRSTRARRSSLYKNNSDGKGNSYGTPRELSRAPRRSSSPTSCARWCRTSSRARSSSAPAKSARRPRPALESEPVFQLSSARRVLRRGRRPRDDAEAPDHQHPRRAPQRRRAVPPTARDHRRRQHEPGGDVREARLDRAACSRRSRTAGPSAFPAMPRQPVARRARLRRSTSTLTHGGARARTTRRARPGTTRTSCGTLAATYVERHRRARPSPRPTRCDSS